MDRQQLRAARALTAVEFLRVHTEHIHPETDGALSEPGFGVEDEVLRPLFSLALGVVRVGEVSIDVGVTQVQRGLGVIDETFGLAGHGQGEDQAAATDQTEGMATDEGGARGAGEEITGDSAHSNAS
ncbi:hypothetical protein D3C86_1667400 [compost metagenome]